ncbi:hypothetical protein C1752_03996 [Acaryochloris thomasi RCC1774]|uniref:2-iminobutanoate/2-iminopropanoate deaminase n=1 Tax=Acaryochloris thomasi RCC1774 TaxID=1764569 RepID=A0A2W1JF93_9CYAN|nr:RidA family protein [Acaryochloris thomasi]PZD72136.1 hypothetical protein C1752_03996 [Acaryochloris thomasi RCC1774]
MNEHEIAAGLAQTPNYQYAQRIGPQLFISGQVPHDSEANLVGIGKPHVQVNQCLGNLRTLITLHGFDKRDIRQLKIYVVGDHPTLMAAWQAVTEWFNNDVPPATLLGVARLAYEHQLVEIDAMIVSEVHS